jgi:antitoxin component HigA of HigAB toxin-antitoxin module
MTATDIRPIRTETDYHWALRVIEYYFEREPRRGTKELLASADARIN